MIIHKKRKFHEIECQLVCLGTVHDNELNTDEFYLRYESKIISDTIALHFTEKEELWLLDYLTNKNNSK